MTFRRYETPAAGLGLFLLADRPNLRDSYRFSKKRAEETAGTAAANYSEQQTLASAAYYVGAQEDAEFMQLGWLDRAAWRPSKRGVSQGVELRFVAHTPLDWSVLSDHAVTLTDFLV